MFIFSEQTLIITIVLDGKGRNLIEFGETGAGGLSLKGELEFPLETPIDEGAPHRQIRNPEYPNISRCFVCHDAERPSVAVPEGLESMPLRPRTSTLVPIETLLEEKRRCDVAAEPERCGYLEALVGHGPLVHRPFVASTPTL